MMAHFLKRIQMSIPWKLFFFLFGASLLGALAVLPYALTPEILKKITMPPWVLISVHLIETAVLYAICISVGLFLAKKVGMGAPILQDYFDGKQIDTSRLIRFLKIGLVCGVLIVVAVVAVDYFAFYQIAVSLNSKFKPELWKRALACFYGGICEEILMRLFLTTTLAWIFLKIKKSDLSVWLAIIVATLVFGLGHLPATATLIALSPLVILRALVLNGIAGISFGWLYWKKGLEAAMIAHFTTDVVLHVVVMTFVHHFLG